MEVHTHFEGKLAILSIIGRIDGSAMIRLEQAAATIVDEGITGVILDLQKVDYVSSAGLRAILVITKTAKAAGRAVAMFGLQPGVDEVMETSGFSSIIPVAATAADARLLLNAQRR